MSSASCISLQYLTILDDAASKVFIYTTIQKFGLFISDFYSANIK